MVPLVSLIMAEVGRELPPRPSGSLNLRPGFHGATPFGLGVRGLVSWPLGSKVGVYKCVCVGWHLGEESRGRKVCEREKEGVSHEKERARGR